MLRMFENRVLRRIFRRKRAEAILEWRRLHNEELYNLYSTKCYSGDKIKKNEMGRASNQYGEISSAYSLLVGRPEGRRQLRRSRCKWEDNVKMILKKWDGT
jgi:hypothetical protein